MPYSSLRAFDELVASGLSERQARAIVRLQEQWRADLVTRPDLDQFESRIKKLFWRAMLIQTGINITIAVAAVTISEAI